MPVPAEVQFFSVNGHILQTRIVCRVEKPHTKTSVIMKYQLIVCLLTFIVFWTGYASRQNPYLNNKSTLGLIGGAAE